ncbi:hypothetical protein S83_024013 [Arachis hypogaea]
MPLTLAVAQSRTKSIINAAPRHRFCHSSHASDPSRFTTTHCNPLGCGSVSFFLLDTTASSYCIISDLIFLHVSVVPAIPPMQIYLRIHGLHHATPIGCILC